MAGSDRIARLVRILENEASGGNEIHAGSWRYMEAVFVAMADSLKRHTEALEKQWPRTNQAAAAFLAHTDQLIQPVQKAATNTAANNATAMANIEAVAREALESMRGTLSRSASISQDWTELASRTTPTDADEIRLMKLDSATHASAERVLEQYKTEVAQTPILPTPEYLPPLKSNPVWATSGTGESGAGAGSGGGGGVRSIPGGGTDSSISSLSSGGGGDDPALAGRIGSPGTGGLPSTGSPTAPPAGGGLGVIPAPILPPIGGGTGGTPGVKPPPVGIGGGGFRPPGTGVPPVVGGNPGTGVLRPPGMGVPPIVGGTPPVVGGGPGAGGIRPGTVPPVVGGGGGGGTGGIRPIGSGIHGATPPVVGGGAASRPGGVGAGPGGLGARPAAIGGVGTGAGGGVGARPGAVGAVGGGSAGRPGGIGGGVVGTGAGGGPSVGGAGRAPAAGGASRPGTGAGGVGAGTGGMFSGGGRGGRDPHRPGAVNRYGNDQHPRGDDELWTLPQGAPTVVEPTDGTYEADPGPAIGR